MADTKTKPTADHRQEIGNALGEIQAAEARLEEARQALEDRMLAAHLDGLSYSALAEISGFSKQHAGHLVTNARDRG